jgi:hypothetical protein
MTTTPDFRALLANDAYAASFQSLGQYRTALLKALATPPPEPPTVMEILELSGEIEDAGLGQIDLVRAAIERWPHR